MSHVFVVDTNKQPLDPVHPARARKLLSAGKAAVLKRYPFTIILKISINDPVVAELRIKIDPGSKTTGLAIVNDQSGEVVFAAELTHRGQAIKESLDNRRGVRRGRRARHTRYRKARWRNRKRPKAWLPPSLQSRIANVITWVRRLSRICQITTTSLELVRFDMQLMENAEISGVEYQQGTLAGYETREYLLEKWGHKCAYCGKENLPLQIEHMVSRAKKGGSNRVSNLCLALTFPHKFRSNREKKRSIERMSSRTTLKRLLSTFFSEIVKRRREYKKKNHLLREKVDTEMIFVFKGNARKEVIE